MKIRDNLAARHRIEGETISKYWVQVNKEKRPWDTLFALWKLDSPVDSPVYEHHTKRIAALASNYHNELQSEGLVEDLTDEKVQEILDHLIPHVTQPDKARLAEYLKESKVKQAIRNLPNEKAPGIDDIPHKLWKQITARNENDKRAGVVFFNVAKVLTKVYNDIEMYGVDPTTEFSVGWLCPFYKKGEKTEISNYRSITVLNTDYRIMTKVFTTKLSPVVPGLIHTD